MSVKYAERGIAYRNVGSNANYKQTSSVAHAFNLKSASSDRIQRFADGIQIVPYNKLDNKIRPTK